eukprot:1214539-Heterocapsa_arctica.AAC.1
MNQAELAVIFKKGFTDLPVNYRPIPLLSLSYNILASIIQKRIAQGRAQEIHEESGQEFLTLLLDWEKAFDKVDQARMIIVLRRMGIPTELVDLI